MVWTKSKINYAFVFEYDTRYTLEWRQLLEVSSQPDICSIHVPHICLDSCFLHFSHGSFHVAQFFLGQYHVHILARRPDWSDRDNRLFASSSAVPSQSEMVGLFERE